MDMSRTPYQRRFDDIKNKYTIWKPVFRDISELILPEGGFFDDDNPNQNIEINYKTMLDGRPANYATIFASGMQSGMTSKASQWFEVTTIDDDLAKWKPAREWFEKVRNILMGIFEASNIYRDFYNVYLENGVFGTGCMAVYYDYENVIRSESHTIGEYFADVNQYGKVDTICRYIQMTVANVVNEFGLNNVSNTVKKLYDDNNLSEYIKVCQLVEPNDGRQPFKKDSANMAFRSVYWEDGSDLDKILRYSGYNRFPYMVPRWKTRTTAEAYGRGSPGWRSLGDSKTLQEFNKYQLHGIARAADPPLQIIGDISGGVLNSLPGAANFIRSNDRAGISSLYDNNFLQGLQNLDNAILAKQQKIAEFFFVDLFKMLNSIDRPQMTAREVAERHEEKLMVLGPILDSEEEEHLDPCIEMAYEIALENNAIPPPPKELEGQELKIEFTSILAQAQKMVGTANIEQFVAFAGGLAAANQEVLDGIDFDETLADYGDKVNFPANCLRSKEQIAELRQARNQAIQQQQQMEQAAAMVQGAKVLSETDTGGNNALTALLNAPGGM
jgi:hypothetical protein